MRVMKAKDEHDPCIPKIDGWQEALSKPADLSGFAPETSKPRRWAKPDMVWFTQILRTLPRGRDSCGR